MTDHELEVRLRRWYHTESPDDLTAPAPLRRSVIAIPALARPRERWWLARRLRIALLAAAALVLLGGAIAVGSGLLHLPSMVPPPSPTEASPSVTPRPSASSATLLGGGLIIVRDAPRDAAGAVLDTVHGFATGTYAIYAIDGGTGERTLLGTVPYDPTTGYQPEVRWAPDRQHILVTDPRGRMWALDGPTAAGHQLAVACCEQPDVVGWVFSPRGDRMAGLHRPPVKLPGQQGTTPVTDGVVVGNVDGSGVRYLPLPNGADSGAAGVGLSWSPDEAALVIAGCRPCNYADPGATPTAVTHSHLFIVPIDGSSVREVLDETREGVFSPSWSPDGASIVVGRRDCATKEIQPYCAAGALTVALVRVADGQQTILSDAPDLASGPLLSPDGRQIAFAVERQGAADGVGGVFVMDADGSGLVRLADGHDPHWSPDSHWLLFSGADGALRAVAADGGAPRLIGPYGGGAW